MLPYEQLKENVKEGEKLIWGKGVKARRNNGRGGGRK